MPPHSRAQLIVMPPAKRTASARRRSTKTASVKSSPRAPRANAPSSPSATSATSNWFFTRHDAVALYVPNLIGYARIACAAYACAVAFDDIYAFFAFYLLSFVCDELDGRFARKFNQCSEFGRVLDMVTDRRVDFNVNVKRGFGVLTTTVVFFVATTD
jgi:hypothetical protein